MSRWDINDTELAARYIPDLIRCLRCQRWEHDANSCCIGNEKCAIFSKQHNVRECPEKEKENEQRELKCTNCGGKHATSYKRCAKFKIANEVTKIQFNSGTKMIYIYAEAIKKRHSEIELKENNNQIKANNGNRPSKSNQSSLLSSESGIKIIVTVTRTRKDSVEPKAQPPSSEQQGEKNNEIVMIPKKIFIRFMNRCSEESENVNKKQCFIQTPLGGISNLGGADD